MTSTLRLGLRSGERIYINGAVIRFDRKVRLELLNDATFLLEAHVMSPDEATTSLRRLYFMVQGILMDPAMKDELRASLAASIELIVREGLNADAGERMRSIACALDSGSYFSALKEIRKLIKCTERSADLQPQAPERQEELA